MGDWEVTATAVIGEGVRATDVLILLEDMEVNHDDLPNTFTFIEHNGETYHVQGMTIDSNGLRFRTGRKVE